MKKKENKTIVFDQVNLFRDDLITIEQIFKKELKVEDYKISFDNYESDSIESIPEDTEGVDKLIIQIGRPYISLEIGGYSPNIWAIDPPIQVEGALSKIVEILNKCERKSISNIHKFFNKSCHFLMFFGFFLLPITFTEAKTIDKYINISRELNIVLLSILLITSISSLYLTAHPVKSKIYFSSRKLTPSFWKKNKDQLIVNLIIALFSIFVTLIVTKLF